MIHAFARTSTASRGSASTTRPPARLAFLDALRGIAALTVFFAHALLQISPAFTTIRYTLFYLGQTGVCIFLLVSGYVITQSISRQSFVQFWGRRFWRLFPLYWMSMTGALLLIAAGGSLEVQTTQALLLSKPFYVVLANATMIQGLFGAPYLLSVYWTLSLELLFYASVSLHQLMRIPVRPVLITLVLLAMAVIIERILQLVGPVLPYEVFTYLAIMWCGAALAAYHAGKVSRWVAIGIFMLTIVVSSLPLDLAQGTYSWMLPQVTGRLVGFGIVAVTLVTPRYTWSPVSVWLGRISYSFYLMHPLVLLAVPKIGPAGIALIIWLSCSLGLAALTERWIERPGNALGRRLTTRDTQRAGG